MKIGQSFLSEQEKVSELVAKDLNDLTPAEYKYVTETLGKHNPKWDNQQRTGQGLDLPKIASKHGNVLCVNDKNPDKEIPKELFIYDLILNDRRFQVALDTLLRINTEEDVVGISDKKIIWSLDQNPSYRYMCFCAHLAAQRQCKKWEMFHEQWMAQKREEARIAIRADRIADRSEGLRKEIGQISSQDLSDWILNKYGNEYKHNLELIREWEEYAQIYLEGRDVLKDRGMHLQSILRRLSDQSAQKIGEIT
jgi:hypothetical protein